MDAYIAPIKTRRCNRGVPVFIGLFFAATFFIVLLALTNTTQWRHVVPEDIVDTVDSFLPDAFLPDKMKPKPVGSGARISPCSGEAHAGSPEVWREAQQKYDSLMSDKFTIAMQTYHRPKELNDTLTILLDVEIPSLHEVVIVWNNLDEKPPSDYTSKHGVPVRYRASPVNSLNQKLWPDPSFRTQAILLSDDDVYYYPDDLEFVFQTWRKFGKQRLTGAMPRCADVGEDGEWKYKFCNRNSDDYSLIITNLAFSHIAFLDYFSSDDPIMSKIRAYVDDHLNCEDIAMNYVHALLTGSGPLLVKGHKEWFNAEPAEGISRKKGHMEARSKCLNDFAEMFGCMPLIEEQVRVERGHQ